MSAGSSPGRSGDGWHRRARPLLGTWVEVGIGPTADAEAAAWLAAAFAAVQQVQDQLSRFDRDSDVGRFQALPAGGHLSMRAATRVVLEAARTLASQTDGLFDVTLGSGPDGWSCDGDRLVKHGPAVGFDLGGIGKGHAVDRAVQVLQQAGCRVGWVNAGGDLRVFGDVDLPIDLRVEATGGVRRFATIRDAAFATSHLGPGGDGCTAARPSRAARAPAWCHGTPAARLVAAGPAHLPAGPPAGPVSVAAQLCLHADALTKVVAATGDPAHPVLALYDAVAWIHDAQ